MRSPDRVLVLGSRGLLGASLVPRLNANGWNVLRHVRAGDAEFVGDLTDEPLVKSALDRLRPDVIVNLAALTNVDDCEEHPQRAYLANVRAVENVVGCMAQGLPTCHLIQLSTDQVYDGAGPHVERDVAPSNYYGFSKYAAELASRGVSTTILRTNFFGPSESPGRQSLSDWIVQALREDREITVFTDVSFSPLSIEYLCGIVETVATRRIPGLFNVGAREGMSKADFAAGITDALGFRRSLLREGRSDDLARPAYRPKDMRLDSSLFEKTFQLKLPTLLDEIRTVTTQYARTTAA